MVLANILSSMSVYLFMSVYLHCHRFCITFDCIVVTKVCRPNVKLFIFLNSSLLNFNLGPHSLTQNLYWFLDRQKCVELDKD